MGGLVGTVAKEGLVGRQQGRSRCRNSANASKLNSECEHIFDFPFATEVPASAAFARSGLQSWRRPNILQIINRIACVCVCGVLLDFYYHCHIQYDDCHKRVGASVFMAKKKMKQKLSAGEMEIMGLLWEHGEISLNEAPKLLGRPIGYTTMQTRLNRLVDKGLASRSTARPAKYEAAASKEDVSANHLDTLLERVTGGRVVPLVAQLVNDRSLTKTELSELKKLIRDAERRLDEKGTT